MFNRSFFAAIFMLIILPFIVASTGDGSWIAKVPDKDRQRSNPYEGDANAVAAGGKLFRQNCASCHGQEGFGRDKHPNLHSDRIRNATPGELQWLLTNGSLKNGMPSWSRLPEPQRWQIITYLKDATKNW